MIRDTRKYLECGNVQYCDRTIHCIDVFICKNIWPASVSFNVCQLYLKKQQLLKITEGVAVWMKQEWQNIDNCWNWVMDT